mmetsp:Transcript_10605/g.30193  ORF Transcript_10605/g.30193 Transcript_10605/m.30193 type:complete len:476 (+) Transcript_10605:231-1658(+)
MTELLDERLQCLFISSPLSTEVSKLLCASATCPGDPHHGLGCGGYPCPALHLPSDDDHRGKHPRCCPPCGGGRRHNPTADAVRIAEPLLPTRTDRREGDDREEMPALVRLPDELLHRIMEILSPSWRGVLRHVCKALLSSVTTSQNQRGLCSDIAVAELCERQQLLEWAHGARCPWDQRLLTSVARHSHLSLLQWAAAKQKADWGTTVTKAAAAAGDLKKLQWLRKQGCPWSTDTCAAAAQGGHIRVLAWAHENGCAWNMMTCVLAAEGGHVEALEWATDHRCPTCKSYTLSCAARAGHLPVLQWAHSQGWPMSVFVAEQAARAGHLDVLKWLRGNGCAWNTQTCNGAAEAGHLHVLKWAVSNGCFWSKHTSAAAAAGGQLEILQWLRSGGCPWDEDCCAAAAKNGHLHVLRWARSSGCPWDERTCCEAAYTGNLSMLQWAYGHGCPLDARTAVVAIRRNHADIRAWMREQGLYD